ncbi:hypothetical protein [Cumulibacter soli]|uniref:hypothetical protein n=1 Tax=Cumulibacter soli TaxID=2546344 RepID=UPI0010678048|nr:hypothetical protein [Cumulibacter soli]
MTNPPQPQWGQPTSGQSPYGAQPTGQYIPGQNQPGQYAQSPYGQPGYGQPGPIQPGYGAFTPPGTPRPNPVAGILLLIGVVVAVLACFIPNDIGDAPLISALNYLPDAIEYVDVGPQGWEVLMSAAAPVILAIGALICIPAGLLMFNRGRHGGAAATGLIGAILMLAAPVLIAIATDGQMFDSPSFLLVLVMIAWIPALIGAFVGFRK